MHPGDGVSKSDAIWVDLDIARVFSTLLSTLSPCVMSMQWCMSACSCASAHGRNIYDLRGTMARGRYARSIT